MADKSLLGFDLANKDPKESLTDFELEHIDEGMKFKNTSSPADIVDFKSAVKFTIKQFPILFP